MGSGRLSVSQGGSMRAEDWDISVCGLNCAKCRLFQSGECGKCRGLLEVHWSPNCRFLPCARQKGNRYCFECDDFICEKLGEFASDGIAHHKRTVENMKEMREIGVEAWTEEKNSKGQCMFCAGCY